jgi:hypothetical protein
MKFGFRIPSLSKRIAARTSWKRIVRHNLGLKAPKGFGWFTDPKKAAYNKVYNKTSRGCLVNLLFLISFGVLTFSIPSCDFKKSDNAGGVYVKPTITGIFRKEHVRKNVSTDKNAIKIQNRSRYYYHTREKYSLKKI